MELHLFVVFLSMVCFSSLILSPTSIVSSDSREGSQLKQASLSRLFTTVPTDTDGGRFLESFLKFASSSETLNNSECGSDSECRGTNYHCFMKRCVCEAGYFWNPSDQSCSDKCNGSDLANEFVEYPDSVLHGFYLDVRDGLSLQDCRALCLNTSSCLAVSFRATGGRCLPHEATALQDPSLWCPTSSKGWTHYQRACDVSKKSTSGSARKKSAQNEWTVFQRRFNGSVDFYRNWTDYETGFGDVNGEFWLGLCKLHNITNTRPHMLHIDLGEVNGHRHYAEYSSFSVGGPETNYTLTVSNYSGDASDSLSKHSAMAFSTYDEEHDKSPSENCAVKWHGAWWYNSCHQSNLNGRYKADGVKGADGITWYGAHTDSRSFTFTEMKLKPA